MRILVLVFAMLVGISTAFGAVNCAAIGQNGWVPRYIPEECYPARTFGIAVPASAARLKEVVQILKTSMSFVDVEVDATASTVTVRGSGEKLAMADWLLRELDQPAAKEALGIDKYVVSTALQQEFGPMVPKPQSANDQVMDVFFLTHVDYHGLQELIATLHVAGDLWTIANDSTGKKLIVRGSEAQMAMAKYLIAKLDVAPDAAAAGADFTSGTDVVRVFFTGLAASPASRREILLALHNVVELKYVVPFTVPAAISVRGSANEIAAADWLIRSLQPKSLSGASEFRFAGTDRPDNVMRMFYQPHAKVDTLKSSKFDSPDALLVRGSASQVAAAEQLMQ